MSKLVLLFTLLISVSVNAAVQETLIVSAVHGELFSQFTMEKKGKKYLLQVTQSNGRNQTRILKEIDFQFILKEFNKLPSTKMNEKECVRARMNVVLLNNGLPRQKKGSCLSQKNVSEPAFARFSQILVNAL